MYESENSLISNLPWSSRALLRPKMFERLSCIFQSTPWRRCQAMNGLMSKSGTENGTAFSAVASSWRLGSRFSSEWLGEGRIIAVQLLRVRFWHIPDPPERPLSSRLLGAKRNYRDFMSTRPSHLIEAAWHVATECGPDGDNLADFELVGGHRFLDLGRRRCSPLDLHSPLGRFGEIRSQRSCSLSQFL